MLSAWLYNEPDTAGLMLGGILILARVYVGALRPGRVRTTTPTEPAAKA